MTVAIAAERPDTPDAIALIGELDAHLQTRYAVESRHGLSVERLLREGVAFFVARDGGRPAGCGGVLLVGREYAEIKRMYVRPAFRGVRERMLGSPREVRLSQSAIDVAALVAYRQPIPKSEIDALRGTDSGPALRQLSRLGLIAVVRRGESKQQEVCYGTTPRFLGVFGLRSLEELPRIGDPRQGE